MTVLLPSLSHFQILVHVKKLYNRNCREQLSDFRSQTGELLFLTAKNSVSLNALHMLFLEVPQGGHQRTSEPMNQWLSRFSRFILSFRMSLNITCFVCVDMLKYN